MRTAANLTSRAAPALAVAVLATVFSPALVSSAPSARTAGVGRVPIEQTAWLLDQNTKTGYRVSEVIELDEYRAYFGLLATTSPTGYRPVQVRQAYGFDEVSNNGAGQIIGIVSAFDNPAAAADLKTFIKTFGLKQMYGLPDRKPCTVAAGPHPCFQLVYAQGTQPAVDPGWALETALDVQWAHAIAQGADILLVETDTNSLGNMFAGVDVAVAGGASVVSMSWGTPEFPVEYLFDGTFDHTGVTFIASSGDLGNGLLYPAASAFVVAVGGTSLPLDKSGGRKGTETAWSGSGGGISPSELEPGYQTTYPIPTTSGFRGNPDVAYNADPATGVSVYLTTAVAGQMGWFSVGGTSAGAPQWAGLTALANQLRKSGNLSSNSLLQSPQYAAGASAVYKKNYRDITAGTNGGCGAACIAGPGYDFVTGLGSPRANKLVRFLGKL